MIGLRLPVLRLNHMLGLASVVLAAATAWPWLVPPVPSVRPLAPAPASAPAPAVAALPPLASYAAVVERPLFSPSRRPPPGASAIQGPSIESRYRLVGIVATGPKRKAFIAEGTQRRQIAPGDTLDGYNVSEIGEDRVKLTSPSGEAVLKLAPAAAEPAKKP